MLNELEYALMSSEIVDIIINDLSGRRGLDIEELVDDTEIYEELIDTLTDLVNDKLREYRINP